MAIAFYFELADMTTEKAEKVLQMLNLNGHAPKGQIFHSEGPLPNGGTWVFDLWETEADMGAFMEKSIGPIAQKLGITPPHPKVYPARVAITQLGMRYL